MYGAGQGFERGIQNLIGVSQLAQRQWQFNRLQEIRKQYAEAYATRQQYATVGSPDFMSNLGEYAAAGGADLFSPGVVMGPLGPTALPPSPRTSGSPRFGTPRAPGALNMQGATGQPRIESGLNSNRPSTYLAPR